MEGCNEFELGHMINQITNERKAVIVRPSNPARWEPLNGTGVMEWKV